MKNDEYKVWTKFDAFMLCHAMEPIAAKHGLHVALTGGCLYKEGDRKDLDILLYRHDPKVEPSMEDFWSDINHELHVVHREDYGRIVKATCKGRTIDFFMIEDSSFGSYKEATEKKAKPKKRAAKKPAAKKPAYEYTHPWSGDDMLKTYILENDVVEEIKRDLQKLREMP